MDLSNLLTFVMPIRIDSKERMRNIATVLSWLSPLRCKLLLLEADCSRHIFQKRIERYKDIVDYTFIKDNNPIFHRTYYINLLLKKAQTDVVAVWDADIITPHSQIYEAVDNIVNKNCTLTYPYSGKYVLLPHNTTVAFIKNLNLEVIERKNFKSLFERPFCGGAFFVQRERYLSLGGENEHFIGWGPEDVERLKRVKIMRHKVAWTDKGAAYHLSHPRNENSNFYNDEVACITRQELMKVCSMNTDELQDYINTWR